MDGDTIFFLKLLFFVRDNILQDATRSSFKCGNNQNFLSLYRSLLVSYI